MSQRYISGLIYNPPGGFSGYFDGSGDFVSAPSNAAFAFGTGDYTIEAWVFPTSVRNGENLIYCTDVTGGTSLGYNQSQVYIGARGVAYDLQVGYTVPSNTWTHLAASRQSGTVRIFANGILVGSGSVTRSCPQGTGAVGDYPTATGNGVIGFISNARVVKGTAVYTAAFDPPNGPLQAITNTSLLTCAYPTFRDGSTNNFTITVNGNTAVSTQNPFPLTQLPNPALGNQGNGVYSMSQYQALRSQNLWPAIDPYFDFVTLMLHGNGTNGAQNNTFLDSSTNNFTITRNGNTTQGTFSPYGSLWSNYFDGTSDWLQIAHSTALDFYGSDFTLEMWANFARIPTGWQNGMVLISKGNDQGDGWSVWFGPDASAPGGYSITINSFATGHLSAKFSTAPTVGPWYHIAFSRTGSSSKAFINGVEAGTGSGTTWPDDSTLDVRIGRMQRDDYPYFTQGYISNLRLIKGTGLYSSNFTPPTAPLTAVTNTSLLTCQSNRFIDNSTNNFTITRNGDVSVQRFSPFNPTTPYAAGTIGGSGYFDGTNDYLSLASNAAFNYGTGDFRFDFWIYPTGGSGPILEQRVNPSTAPYVGYDATNQRIEYYINSGGTLLTATPNGSVQPNQWSFITVSRVSNTSRIFVNGVERSSAADNNNYGTTYLLIGASISGGGISSSTFPGYMGDYRVVKGSGVSSGFSVPTSPLTAITNTSLLCNFTNAAIIDNAMMNDLETVGNAQISTSVSKFGGGSIYLDGTDDRLTAINRENFNFGTGDFTVEFWINASASGSFTQVVGTLVTGTEAGTWRIGNRFNSTNAVYFARGNGSGYDEFNVAVNVNDGAWHHVAVTRASGTVRIFVDGTQAASSSITGTCSSSNPLTIGYNQRDNTYVTGYIDDLRITKGYARYTTSFTPQRSQWQDQ